MPATIEEYKIATGNKAMDSATTAQVTYFLQVAATRIKLFLGEWPTDEDGSLIAADRQIQMVKRKMNNEGGIVAESADGFSISYDPDSIDGIVLTAQDKQILESIPGLNSGNGGMGVYVFSRNGGYAW